MPDFQLRPLGEITTNFDRLRIPVRKRDRSPGPYPYYGASGVADYVSDYIFEGEYLLIAEDGENLRTRKTPIAFLATGRFWVNNHAHVVRGNEHASTRFLRYALRDCDLTPFLTGSTRPKLTQRDLNRILVPCPTVREQRRIASVLGSLDAKIALNSELNETIEQMAQALFASRFLEADGPADAVEHEPGTGQRGSRVGRIADLATLRTESVTPAQSPELAWEHFSIPAFDNGRWPATDLGTSIKSNKYAVPVDAVLVSKLNPRFPRIWMADPSRPSAAVCSTEFMPFVPRGKVPRTFLYDLFKSQPVHDAMLARVTGSTGSRQRVKPKDVAQIPIVIPPADAMARFDRLAGPMHQRRLKSIRESRTLAELRDTLLPKLISGEIRVPEAEAEVEAAV